MNIFGKSLLAALAATLILGIALASASANRIAFSEGAFRLVFSPLSILPSFGTSARCPVTLAGSFHSRTITKTAGSLIGYINAVAIGTCELGAARVNTETLPWHIQYASFAGTLPAITVISHNLIRPSFEIQGEIFGLRVTCRYTTPVQQFIDTRETTRGNIAPQTPGTELTSSETGGCPSIRFSGRASVDTPGGVTISAILV
jgi:hypothetical protein